jgi:pimeloyl-ACP methyl ester carboxylesterase
MLLIFLSSCAMTLPIRDAAGSIVPDSIAEITTVTIDGIDNCIVIRGRNVHNPVLLFLHGGPGTPELPLLSHFNRTLEDDFVVVYWEQPGTGKSYSESIPDSAMSIDKFVEYTRGIIDYLRARFSQDRVFLVGHSWGSIIALLTAKRYPQLLVAVVGVGQIVNVVDSELISFRYTLDKAREKKNDKAVRELSAMGDPPSYLSLQGDWYDDFMTKRKWTIRSGLSLYGESSYRKYERYFLEAPEYTILDYFKYTKGRRFSARTLVRDMMRVDLSIQAREIEVPVYFMMGKYDVFASTNRFDVYVKMLKAPKKEVIWFKRSAHFVPFEEAPRFNAEMIRIMKENTPDTRTGDRK